LPRRHGHLRGPRIRGSQPRGVDRRLAGKYVHLAFAAERNDARFRAGGGKDTAESDLQGKALSWWAVDVESHLAIAKAGNSSPCQDQGGWSLDFERGRRVAIFEDEGSDPLEQLERIPFHQPLSGEGCGPVGRAPDANGGID